MGCIRLVLAVLALWAAVPAQESPPPVPVPLQVTGLDPLAPLTVSAELRGLELRLHVALQADWHLYASDVGGGQPVQVDITAGSAFAAAGPLQAHGNQKGEITGEATLVLPLRAVAGQGLAAKFRFMTCDAMQCLPPMAVDLATPPAPAPAPLRVLLVVTERGERSARIAGFLTERGFQTKVTTYADVQQAECDAEDVVLCDSPTFGQTKGARAAVQRFPLTSTPMVAVGFLGTELLKAQKVTMACGYV